MCKEDSTYKETTIGTLKSYISPWTAYLVEHRVQPSTPVLAEYINNRGFAGSTKQRVAKSLIHFCGVAMPGVPLVYKLPVRFKDKKPKVEVTEDVMEQLRLATITDIYGSTFADRVLQHAKMGKPLGKQNLRVARTYTNRVVPTEKPATEALKRLELRTLA